MNQRRITTEEVKNRLTEYLLDNSNKSNYLRIVPERYQPIMYKCYEGNKSNARAVKAKCLECSGFKTKEVKLCQVDTCPLWKIRPFQSDEV